MINLDYNNQSLTIIVIYLKNMCQKLTFMLILYQNNWWNKTDQHLGYLFNDSMAFLEVHRFFDLVIPASVLRMAAALTRTYTGLLSTWIGITQQLEELHQLDVCSSRSLVQYSPAPGIIIAHQLSETGCGPHKQSRSTVRGLPCRWRYTSGRVRESSYESSPLNSGG